MTDAEIFDEVIEEVANADPQTTLVSELVGTDDQVLTKVLEDGVNAMLLGLKLENRKITKDDLRDLLLGGIIIGARFAMKKQEAR